GSGGARVSGGLLLRGVAAGGAAPVVGTPAVTAPPCPVTGGPAFRDPRGLQDTRSPAGRPPEGKGCRQQRTPLALGGGVDRRASVPQVVAPRSIHAPLVERDVGPGPDLVPDPLPSREPAVDLAGNGVRHQTASMVSSLPQARGQWYGSNDGRG